MTVEDENIRSLLSGWGLAAKPCDSCNSSPSVLFCRNHSAFLCSPCDADIHQGQQHHHQQHERVWICEVCEQAPAAFTCKADAASLCVSCDRDIHSANPLSRRHHRDPVVPFLYSPAAKHSSPLAGDTDHSWLIPNHNSVLFDHLDPCLNFGEDNGIKNPPDSSYYLTTTPAFEIEHQQREYEHKAKVGAAAAPVHDASHHQQLQQQEMMMMMMMSHQLRNVSDGVVPTVTTARSMDDNNNNNNSNNSPSMNYDPFMTNFNSMQKKKVKKKSCTTTNNTGKDCFEIDFTQPELSPVFYASSQSLSVSSSDTGVVPDGGASNNSMSEVSNNPLFSKPVPAAAVPLSKAEREARVMRYREKRKNRKFEKTIRYASRKAYAESRPRNKGRFAKRIADPDDEDGDGIYGVTGDGAGGDVGGFVVVDHCGYSVVPTF